MSQFVCNKHYYCIHNNKIKREKSFIRYIFFVHVTLLSFLASDSNPFSPEVSSRPIGQPTSQENIFTSIQMCTISLKIWISMTHNIKRGQRSKNEQLTKKQETRQALFGYCLENSAYKKTKLIDKETFAKKCGLLCIFLKTTKLG